jgi:predicted GTPase
VDESCGEGRGQRADKEDRAEIREQKERKDILLVEGRGLRADGED